MAERVSKAQRVRMQHVAEREVMRFKDDHALWHKYIHNVELDPMQVFKCLEMDHNQGTIDFSCRRTGKTAIKELYFLKENATHGDQELGIVAPREAQSLVNLNYHLEAIRRSPILTNYLDYRSGRQQFSDTYYRFVNRSSARAYGIMAQVDGGDLTMASLEEVDDMPRDRLFSRFLLMMGSARRLGASKEARNDPQIRITGVFKGADTLTRLIDDGKYHVLPTINAYLGMEMGILNEQFMLDMRDQLSPDEYIRQLLCVNVSARNLIWERYVREALQYGLKAGLNIAQPLPGMKYKRRGLIAFGYDHSGHGENAQSSKYALVVTELIGNFVCFIFAKTWAPGTDEAVVKNDIKGFWRYFVPDYAMGDAFGVGVITQVNHELYAEGLIDTDIRAIEDGQSTQSTWPNWAFSPIQFQGMTKHSMAHAIRSVFHNRTAAIPYIDDHDLDDPETRDMRALIRQLPNIRPEQTRAAYSTYKMANAKLGDDLFDAAMASVWALATRGGETPKTAVRVSTTTREQLLYGNTRLAIRVYQALWCINLLGQGNNKWAS